MNDRRSLLAGAGLLAAALLLLVAVWNALAVIGLRLDPLLYGLVGLVVFLDALDLFLRLYLRRVHAAPAAGGSSETSMLLAADELTPYQKRLHLRPYALCVSVYNAEAILDEFCEAMEPYREHVWLIDDASTDATATRLRQAGWRVVSGGVNRNKPGAIRELLRHLPPEIETVMVLDPDARIHGQRRGRPPDLERVIFDFQVSRMAAFCPRLAIGEGGLLARLQAFEYCLAFRLGRASLADRSITSGIAVYRRDALQGALAGHSLSVYAEDLENALLLLAAGEGIYYDGRLVVETEAKESWRGWFSQRVGWAYGLLRLYAERFTEVRAVSRATFVSFYQYFIYLGVVSLALHPFKLISLILLLLSLGAGVNALLGLGAVQPEGIGAVYFLVVYGKYTALLLLAWGLLVPRGERLHLLPVVPLYFFYALLLLVPTTVGYANWVSLRLGAGRVFKDHYQDEKSLVHEGVARRAALPGGEAR